ncbi:MAG: 3TM-type holin [Candidatus Margulisiibacteriota bacterium]|nr:3TM-type holin [Candidatus Margulisiibacteriota bacterium]
MSIINMVGELFKPVTKIVDDLHTSEEEKFVIKKEMAKLESDIQVRVLDYEKQMIQSKSSIISAEANGQSWLQRNWRPITMLTFLGLVVCDSFGLLTFRLAPEAWTLLQIGMGGYVIGRSCEKVLPSILKK